jgi:hypothetical protein
VLSSSLYHVGHRPDSWRGVNRLLLASDQFLFCSRAQEAQASPEKGHKRTLGSSILGFFRGTTASGVEKIITVPRLPSNRASNATGPAGVILFPLSRRTPTRCPASWASFEEPRPVVSRAKEELIACEQQSVHTTPK